MLFELLARSFTALLLTFVKVLDINCLERKNAARQLRKARAAFSPPFVSIQNPVISVILEHGNTYRSKST